MYLKRLLPLSLVAPLLVAGMAGAQAHQAAGGTDGGEPFSTMHRIDAGDSPEVIEAKAATVLPRPNQVEWMRLERTFFIHFGPNTFRGVEWGNGHEDPSVFQPSALDADQWVRSIKEAGGKMVILVCKHHDGFALWPSRYSSHTVAASPWRGGKGDVVREVAQAAHKYGIELGVYLSPADLYQLRTNTSNPKGYYGDGSKPAASTIPTDPASFLSNPVRTGYVPADKPTFHYTVDDYNRYFLNQLYELLTQYGPIREVWFDGANPDASVQEQYDYQAWYSMIRKLQPHAFIFGKGPDGRWVGNEDGVGRTTEWDVIPLPQPPDEFRWPDMTDNDLGSRAKLTPGSYLWWYPAEVDVPILHGWFWSPTKACRTATELIDIYYTSVGRNSTLLLDLAPDNRGLIPDDQLAQLRVAADHIRRTFVRDVLQGARVTADSSAANHPAAAVLNGGTSAWWEPVRGRKDATLTFTLPKAARFDVVALEEAVDERGQRIERFTVEALEQGRWQQVQEGTTVGHKRLLRLPAPVTAEGLRIHISASRLEPSLSKVGLFLQPPVVAAPVISRRDGKGFVRITAQATGPIVYTLDGSIPDTHSARYTGPVDVAEGATVMAAVLAADNTTGMVGERRLAGLAPIGWKSVDTAGDAAAAIDDDPATTWKVENASVAGHPVALTVDMGKQRSIRGFAYLPSAKEPGGTIERYRFETSIDGKAWQVAASGDFDNIRHNPDEQQVLFSPRLARFFRLIALGTVGDGKSVSAAEVTVLPSAGKP